MKKGIGFKAVAALVLAGVLIAQSCGADLPFKWGTDWEGSAYDAAVLGIEVPDVVESGLTVPVTVVIGLGTPAAVIRDKDIDVSAERRTVTIHITARNMSGCWPAMVPPPEGLRFPVHFTETGQWTIRANDETKSVVVRGEWSGEERPVEPSDFSLWNHIYAGYHTTLTLSVPHESGSWFCNRLEVQRDNPSRTFNVRCYERRANSAWDEGAWAEQAELKLMWPDEEPWRVVMGRWLVADRKADPGEYGSETPSLIELYWGSPYESASDAPQDVSFAEPVFSGLPTDVTLTFLRYAQLEFVVTAADYRLDPDAMTLTAIVHSNAAWQASDETELAEYSTALTFPLAGEWTIVFPAYEEPYTASVIVLPFTSS